MPSLLQRLFAPYQCTAACRTTAGCQPCQAYMRTEVVTPPALVGAGRTEGGTGVPTVGVSVQGRLSVSEPPGAR